MSAFLNGNRFTDRQAAAKARKEMAEKFLANSKYDPADPAVVEREAQRKEILEARKSAPRHRTRGRSWRRRRPLKPPAAPPRRPPPGD